MTIIIPAYGYDEDGNEALHKVLIFLKDIEVCEEMAGNTVITLKSDLHITTPLKITELQKIINKADTSNLIRLN
jgi:hypothetical protein